MLDEWPQGAGQICSLRLRYGREPAVLGQACPGVATQEGHELGGGAQLVDDEPAVRAPWPGPSEALDGVGQSLLDRAQVLDRHPRADAPVQLELGVVEVHH